MKGLLVRVGADQSEYGGYWNSPIDGQTREFVYVSIPEFGAFRPRLATPYSLLTPPLGTKWPSLPGHLVGRNMHLDPDFSHLTYGDQGSRANQIQSKLTSGDLLVFYAGLEDIHPNPRLIYAIIGLLVIDKIVPAGQVPAADFHMNAHTRRLTTFSSNDIVVHGRPKVSGRVEQAIPIGYFQDRAYRVVPPLLAVWGGLGVKDGYLQRSAQLPEFINAPVFYRWLLAHKIPLLQRNN